MRFDVARFDLSGNARASIRGTSDRTGSTFEPEINFSCFDYQYVTYDHLMH